jgi:hypothetical protein
MIKDEKGRSMYELVNFIDVWKIDSKLQGKRALVRPRSRWNDTLKVPRRGTSGMCSYVMW